MKKFFDEIFKPYLFPIILLIIGTFLKAAENLKFITIFFSNKSSKFLKLFNYQFYLWELILYLACMYLFILLSNYFFRSYSKKERKMIKTLKSVPNEKNIMIKGTLNKILFKFKPSVKNENYLINELHPYCLNCTDIPIRMTLITYGDYRCNCGIEVNYSLYKDVESIIISDFENKENFMKK